VSRDRCETVRLDYRISLDLRGIAKRPNQHCIVFVLHCRGFSRNRKIRQQLALTDTALAAKYPDEDIDLVAAWDEYLIDLLSGYLAAKAVSVSASC
jgi:hypothetical protein